MLCECIPRQGARLPHPGERLNSHSDVATRSGKFHGASGISPMAFPGPGGTEEGGWWGPAQGVSGRSFELGVVCSGAATGFNTLRPKGMGYVLGKPVVTAPRVPAELQACAVTTRVL